MTQQEKEILSVLKKLFCSRHIQLTFDSSFSTQTRTWITAASQVIFSSSILRLSSIHAVTQLTHPRYRGTRDRINRYVSLPFHFSYFLSGGCRVENSNQPTANHSLDFFVSLELLIPKIKWSSKYQLLKGMGVQRAIVFLVSLELSKTICWPLVRFLRKRRNKETRNSRDRRLETSR